MLKAALTSGGGSDLKYDDAKVYASTENLSKTGGEGPGSHCSTLSELGRLLLQVNNFTWNDNQKESVLS